MYLPINIIDSILTMILDDVNKPTLVNYWYDTTKNKTRLRLSKSDVNQELLNDLSKFLQMKECLINELVFDGINLKNTNYLCCLISNTKISKLWLRCCQLKDKGVNNLLPILDETHEKSQLNLLNLDCNGITCEGAKKLAQVLRTNRSLHTLSLARNVIKNEGALALVNVLSKFKLNDYETKWKFKHEQRRIRLVEYLVDCIALKLDEEQENIPLKDSNYTVKVNNAEITSINEDNLKQRAESMLLSNSHAFTTGLLLKSGSSFYCPGNFKIQFLNISYNRFSFNILRVIEQTLRYQQKICLAGEGIKTFKVEGFEIKQIESIYKLVEEKRRNENKNTKTY